jgi:hypothetical protein
MFLAIILACTTPSFQSCGVMVNTELLFLTEEQCHEDADPVAAYIRQQGTFAVPYCVKLTSVGEPT